MQQELIPHLFRTEYSKIVAVLGKLLGMQHIDVAEDIAADTFLSAIENWTYKGMPENAVAWLYVVAKNKARNYLKRDNVFRDKVAKAVVTQDTFVAALDEIDLTNGNISDSQLQMLFAVCHPLLSVEAQIGLALRVLCGFGIDEVANALLSNKETILKRLYRAKQKLREADLKIEMPAGAEIGERLDSVLTTLYLLFNEGYYSESDDRVIREDLCMEAIRLTSLLIEHKETRQPKVLALLALMYFQSSRFAARMNEHGSTILYDDQDETLWDKERIAQGVYFLHEASHGNMLSKYHLEASIAYWHTQKADSNEKWEHILHLFNHLLRVEYSPVAALNRTFALYKVFGRESAIDAALKLKLDDNPYYYTLLGELYSGLKNEKAIACFKTAHRLARTISDKAIIQAKISKLI